MSSLTTILKAFILKRLMDDDTFSYMCNIYDDTLDAFAKAVYKQYMSD